MSAARRGFILVLVLPSLASGCRRGTEPAPVPPSPSQASASPGKTAASDAGSGARVALELPREDDGGSGRLALPPVLGGVTLGIDRARLLLLRPRAYASRARSRLYHETLGPNLSAHYRFDRGHLYSVLLRQYGGADGAARLRRRARRRWGKPSRIETAALYSAPGALVRVDTDLGNLIVEYTTTQRRRARQRGGR